jgi:ABC-type multidrug transport system fused ATPase/permease subunit
MANLIWILRIIIEKKWSYCIILLLAVTESFFPLFSIYLQKYLIDDVFLMKQFEFLAPILFALIAAMIAADILYSTVLYSQLKLQAHLRRILTYKFLQCLHIGSIQKLRNQRTGKYIQNVNGDVENVSSLIAMNVPNNLKIAVELITLIVIVGISAPLVLLLALIVSPIYIALGKFFAPRLKKISKEKQERKSDFVTHLEEGISGTREVIAFNRRKWEAERFNLLFHSYFISVMSEGRLAIIQSITSDPLKWTVNLMVLGYGGYSVMQGNMSPGTFVVIYQLAGRLIDSIQKAYGFVVNFAASTSSIDRYLEAINDMDVTSEGHVKLKEAVSSLRFEEVCFTYDDAEDYVLNRISLDLPVGKKIAFVGTSGGGKSTIAQMLIRYLEPSKGIIWVNKRRLNEISIKDWLSKVSIVFQEPYLFPDTIRNNIKLGRKISDEEMKQACKLAKIDDVISALAEGYETQLGERGITLSGGQRQRLAIARALCSHAEILILDEATFALDMETERILQKAVDEIRQGKTTIIVAHRLSTIENADIIYVLDNGTIIEKGSHQELMGRDSKYKELVQKDSLIGA